MFTYICIYINITANIHAFIIYVIVLIDLCRVQTQCREFNIKRVIIQNRQPPKLGTCYTIHYYYHKFYNKRSKRTIFWPSDVVCKVCKSRVHRGTYLSVFFIFKRLRISRIRTLSQYFSTRARAGRGQDAA